MTRLRSWANAAQKSPRPTRQPRQALARRNESRPVQSAAPQDAYRRVRTAGAGLRPAELVTLQRAVGNRLVQRTRSEQDELQPKRSLWVSTQSNAAAVSHQPKGAADPHGGVLQRVTNYNTLDGATIYATVDDSGSPITMTGSLRQTATTVLAINGSLSYHEVKIPRAAVSDSIFASRSVRALEISTVTANPQGRRIGQLLAWHLARLARAAGIGHITAGNVTAARGSFYTPLGFVDFKNAASWASLVARKAQLEQQMAAQAPPSPAIAQEYGDVLQAMAANKIFISVADLEANSEQRWRQEWAPE
jgi:hypothetical protein